jgi:hypothetical protein
MSAFRAIALGALAILAASASICGQSSNEQGPRPSPDANAKVILEVVNNQFTMGRKIPSIYLRLFSDGTAECQTRKFTAREDLSTKNATLPPKEFAEIRAVLNKPGLRGVKGRYEHPRVVFDSWMEWELRAPDSQLTQDVTISFGPATQQLRTYPEALATLGCQIIKIRAELCGDKIDYYRPACVNSSVNDMGLYPRFWTERQLPTGVGCRQQMG